MIRIKDPERKYEKKPLNKILINQAKVPIFLDRKVRLKPNQAVKATFRMRNLNELSNDRHECLVPNPNSKSSAILGRSFSLTQIGLCVSILLNTEATTVTIQRGKKLGYALPLNTDFQSVENLKMFDVTKCPLHANQECILKRENELKSSRKLFSMKSETDDGLGPSNYEPRNRDRPRAAPSRPGWTNPVPPEADATPETRLPTVPQVSSVPELTTISQETMMYASMFEPLNRSLETFITKLSKSTERG